MCLALAAPAFATTSQSGNLSTELSSKLPELKLTLPDTATIILNPYRNQVDDSVATASVGIDKGDKLQVMNPVFAVVSTTTSKVNVSAVVTGKVGGNAEFSSATVPVGAAGHRVNLTLTYKVDAANSATAALTPPVPDNVDVTKATNVKTVSDSEQTLTWTLPAAASSGNGSAQRLNLQFGGTCSDSPTADDGPWKESDTVSASFVFSASVVTDDPMVTAMYQATAGATSNDPATHPNDFTVNTWNPKPSDFKEIKSGEVGLKTIEYKGASDSSFQTLAAANWGTSNWDGSKITLDKAQLGTVLGATEAIKIVKFTLQYTDKAGVTQNPTYTVKVYVLDAAPAST